MKKIILLTLLVLAISIAGCSTAKFSSTQYIGVMLNLTTDDVIIEKKISYSIPYDKDDLDLKSTVYEAAVNATGYDLIILPSYEIIISSSPFVKDRITVSGYGAKLKGVQPLSKPEIKKEQKVEAKPEIKSEVKPEAKPEVKPEAKSEPKEEVKPIIKIDNKTTE